MTLRLVLVSLVAGLGISLPGWPILESWVASTQKWMNARLASMESRRSDDKNYVVIHDLLKVEMERVRQARIRRLAATRQTRPTLARSAAVRANHAVTRTVSLEKPAHVVHNALAALPMPVELHELASPRVRAELSAKNQVAPTRPAFEPLVVGDRLFVGTAYELNFQNEGIGILPRTTPDLVSPSPLRPAELMELFASRYGSEGIEAIRELGRDLRAVAAREIAERDRVAAETAERDRIEPERLALKPAAPDSDFQDMERSATLYFAEAPAEPVVAGPVVVQHPSFEAMEKSENLYFAESLATGSTRTTSDEENVASIPNEPVAGPASGTLPANLFAPVGSTIVSSPRLHDVRTARPEVNRAVRLTRDALSAWVNVLTGPALVTVGQSSSASR